jgi:hypothetical protein
MSEWQEIRNAAGEVVGWTQPPDPDEPDVDYFEADRLPKVKRRAEVIDQAVDAMLTESLDQDAVWDACEERMPPGMVDAAGSVAFTLWKIEHRYPED